MKHFLLAVLAAFLGVLWLAILVLAGPLFSTSIWTELFSTPLLLSIQVIFLLERLGLSLLNYFPLASFILPIIIASVIVYIFFELIVWIRHLKA